jgi:hypothetical protein
MSHRATSKICSGHLLFFIRLENFFYRQLSQEAYQRSTDSDEVVNARNQQRMMKPLTIDEVTMLLSSTTVTRIPIPVIWLL